MTDCVIRAAMLLAGRIEVRTSGRAAVGVVAEFVNVEAVLTGLQAGDLSSHVHVTTLQAISNGNNQLNCQHTHTTWPKAVDGSNTTTLTCCSK